VVQIFRDQKAKLYSIPDIGSSDWKSIRELVERPWFSRAWIIQEVVVSREAMLHCGSSSLPWTDFHIGFLFLKLNFIFHRPDIMPSLLTYERVMQLVLTYSLVEGGMSSIDLAALLENHMVSKAANPIDKLYSLLGVYEMTPNPPCRIVPDYRRSVTEVFTEVAQKIIESSSTLDVLGAGRGTSTSSLVNLPSWAPDWSRVDVATSLCFKSISGSYVFNFDAANTSNTQKHTIFKGKTLELSGHEFDKVSKIGRYSDLLTGLDGSYDTRARALSTRIKWTDLHWNWEVISGCLSKRKYPTGENILDAFLRTIFLDKFSNGYTIDDAKRHRDLRLRQIKPIIRIGAHKLLGVAQCIERNNPFSIPFRIGLRPITDQSQQKYPAGAMTVDEIIRSLNRRMIVTAKGYIGLAPCFTREGDSLVIVKGGRVPLVIRPRDQGWELIGDCYVHGIMYGEAFDDAQCENISIL
jgi:hypothetical protein